MSQGKPKQKPELTIFEEQKKAKISAKKCLELAKNQESEKLKSGFAYQAIDSKTMVLRKTN